MTDNLFKYGVLVGIVVIAGVALWATFGGSGSQEGTFLGSIGQLKAENYINYVRQNEGYYSERAITLSGADGDITAGDDLTVTDDLAVTDDVIISGGTITVTTTNAATSTAIVGCIQTYATSTATAVRLTLSPFAGTSTTQGGTSSFLVAAQYGSCPI